MAAMVVYQERQNHGSDDHTRDPAEEQLARRPISASEVDEASNLVFRRSSTPSGDMGVLPKFGDVERNEYLHIESITPIVVILCNC